MLGWCEAIARNPHRIPSGTRTPELSGDLADVSTLVSACSFHLTVGSQCRCVPKLICLCICVLLFIEIQSD